jgi:hypothetical protein
MKFGDFHEFKNFNDDRDKMNWWKGRLVKTKYNIRGGLFDPVIFADTVGVVVDIYRTEAFGDALVVHWINNEKSNQICIHDVYSSGGQT